MGTGMPGYAVEGRVVSGQDGERISWLATCRYPMYRNEARNAHLSREIFDTYTCQRATVLSFPIDVHSVRSTGIAV